MKEHLDKFWKETKDTELQGEQLTQYLLWLVWKGLQDNEAKMSELRGDLEYLANSIQRDTESRR